MSAFSNSVLSPAWRSLSGELPVLMMNDYLARIILQQNEPALRFLICSVLKIDPGEIQSLVIENPIIPGDAIDEKEYILDILLTMNDSTSINLELQVVNEHNWPERSLCYLCRSFDRINRGENYLDIRTAIHIGILGFVPIPEDPSFYASYRLLNVLTHHEYSSKIQLYVLSLPMKEQAADDDILHHLDLWAAFFSARTWEELRMAAEKDPVIEKTVDEAYKLMMDEKVRRQCEAREEYYRIRNTDKLLLQRAEEKLQAAERELAELKRRLAEYEAHENGGRS